MIRPLAESTKTVVQPVDASLPEFDGGRRDTVSAPERGQRISPSENFRFISSNFCSSTEREEITLLCAETRRQRGCLLAR